MRETISVPEKVQEIYDRLKEPEGFPKRLCKLVAKALHDSGYPVIKGVLRFNNYCGLNRQQEIPHYWNYDPETGYSIDLTVEEHRTNVSDRELLPEGPIAVWDPEEYRKVYHEEERDVQPPLF